MKCDYCNQEIKDGFLGYDFYTLCVECILKVYTESELREHCEKGLIFWTNFYNKKEECQ